jgi:uncharacterized protein
MKKLILIVLVALALAFSVVSYGYMKSQRIRFRTAEFVSENLPKEFDGTKVTFISDLYFGNYFNQVRLRETVRTINSQSPDIILLGGNYVTDDANLVDYCFDELRNLDASMGVYAVRGIADIKSSFEKIKLRLMKSRFQLCENSTGSTVEKNGSKIHILGMHPAGFDEIPKFANFTISFGEYYESFKNIETGDIDFFFAGNGAGKLKTGETNISGVHGYISAGTGNKELPFRFLHGPEVITYILKSK